jgi:hypothetical protein
VADLPSEQYRATRLKYHEFQGYTFRKPGKEDAQAPIHKVAAVIAADMTEEFTMGVYIPKTAPVNFIG